MQRTVAHLEHTLLDSKAMVDHLVTSASIDNNKLSIISKERKNEGEKQRKSRKEESSSRRIIRRQEEAEDEKRQKRKKKRHCCKDAPGQLVVASGVCSWLMGMQCPDLKEGKSVPVMLPAWGRSEAGW